MPLGARYKPKDKNELLDLLRDGVECKNIDFSLLVDLKELFENKEDILLQDNVYFIDPNNPDLLIWNTSNVNNMDWMFSDCKNFNKPVRLDSSNATSMYGMFYMCENFNQSVNFDTSNVTSMSNMFYECKKFNQPVNFDTSNVTDMRDMFFGCENFNQPVNFDTFNVTDMYNMFYRCEKFNQPVNFDVSNVEDMRGMFDHCKKLNSEIKLKNIGKNVDKVKIEKLFYECDKLELKNIQLDITDCNKLEGDKIYKNMDKDEFCLFFIKEIIKNNKNNNNFDIDNIIDKLKSLMF